MLPSLGPLSSLASILKVMFFSFLPSWGLKTGLMHGRQALHPFTTLSAFFVVCLRQGPALLLGLGFIHSVTQAGLELATLSSQPPEGLR